MVAQQTLTLYVRVRILHPLPKPRNFGFEVFLCLQGFAGFFKHNYLVLCDKLVAIKNNKIATNFATEFQAKSHPSPGGFLLR